MTSRGVLLLLPLCLSASAASALSAEAAPAADTAPHWPTAYTVQGMLVIPYAEIEEPFAAFADLDNGHTRIDYYGGMVRTFQRADQAPHGKSYKVAPMSSERVLNQINCFETDGDADAPVETQSILPDLTGFEFKGREMFGGENCDKWQRKQVDGQKVSKYTMLLKMRPSNLKPNLKMAIPLHYEMKGYNNLLGSHYDHYYLTYTDFSSEVPDPSVFDEYSKFGLCHGFPGPGAGDHVYLMNPMKEFVNGHTTHVDESFEQFKASHEKQYKNDMEHDTRKDIFRQNQRFIHSHNRQNKTYTVATNHLADRTSDELRQLRGKLYTPGYNGGAPFSYNSVDLRDAPASLDWRLFGAVTPVKDQVVCGSCWSFGTTGTLEGALFLQTGVLTPLSQQALMDCSWGYGNNGCDGGEDFRSYQFIMKHGGLPSSEAYGPYLGRDGFCHMQDVQPSLKIKSYVNVTSGDPKALKVAIAKHGPVSVAIDASHKSLSFYSNGIYYEPKCNNTAEGLDHAVLAVGYGHLMGQDYWLVKNSWSTYWGNDGYVLMSQKDNNCGVATGATYVIPEKIKP